MRRSRPQSAHRCRRHAAAIAIPDAIARCCNDTGTDNNNDDDAADNTVAIAHADAHAGADTAASAEHDETDASTFTAHADTNCCTDDVVVDDGESCGVDDGVDVRDIDDR